LNVKFIKRQVKSDYRQATKEVTNLLLQGGAEKLNHHVVREHNLHKLLLNNGFILVECRCQRQDPKDGDDKELIFFAILLMLNILCDVIHDAIDKHVYV